MSAYRFKTRGSTSQGMAQLNAVWLVVMDVPRSTPMPSSSSRNWRLSRSPHPRCTISLVIPARPSRSSGSTRVPAGSRNANAAERSQGIGSPSNTNPFSNA